MTFTITNPFQHVHCFSTLEHTPINPLWFFAPVPFVIPSAIALPQLTCRTLPCLFSSVLFCFSFHMLPSQLLVYPTSLLPCSFFLTQSHHGPLDLAVSQRMLRPITMATAGAGSTSMSTVSFPAERVSDNPGRDNITLEATSV